MTNLMKKKDEEEEEEESSEAAVEREAKEEIRKIAVYGLPSAGKSTLMNAMAGRKVTSTSATPGHTKHIQTWYVRKSDKSPRVAMLCDSPGLVVRSRSSRYTHTRKYTHTHTHTHTMFHIESRCQDREI